MSEAFGAPGLDPTWTSSAKDMVSTAIGGTSRVWLTIGHGIGNEVYWPSTGQPQVRDIGFIVSGAGGWVEVKRASDYTLSTPSPDVLAPTVIHHGDGWELTLAWVVDPDRDVVIVEYRLDGTAEGLYVLIAPHLGAGTTTNTAWVDDDLHAVADSGEVAMCATCDRGFIKASAGYVGASDGWQDLTQHGAMAWEFTSASNGNVALMASLPLGDGRLALGFAPSPSGASILARSSLAAGTATARERLLVGWQTFAAGIDTSSVGERWADLARHSAAVLACHEDRTYPGATVASLSIPWGNDRIDLGGYHLVWARDCVEVAFAHVALGDLRAARRTLSWLCAAQQPDGHWTQNAYPDGRPYWTGVQLDEVALPVILAAALEFDPTDPAVATMVRRAVGYLIANGPATPEDRWEENAGASAFTLAAVIAALIAAEPWLDADDAEVARSTADYWNERIEDWLYVANGDLCHGRGIAGYYVRIGRTDGVTGVRGRIEVRNQAGLQLDPAQLISGDFLALVRLGLRQATDQRIVDSVALIDELLAVRLPTGIAYRRYNNDGYGEHDDGSPFDGTGIGRPWPLLAGERGHYAAQAGEDPAVYLDSMAAMTGPGGLLPEQVWDAAPIRERFLEPGHPTGSAMPLAWAHAEFVKLATYRSRNRPVEQLAVVAAHFAAPSTPAWRWRVDLPFAALPGGRDLVVEHPDPFVLRTRGDSRTAREVGFGRYAVVLGASELPLEFELLGPEARVLGGGSVIVRQ